MRKLAAAAFVVFALAVIWLASLAIGDGFDVHIFGVLVRSHDVIRPGVLALLSLALFFWAGGRQLAADVYRRSRHAQLPSFERYWAGVATLIALAAFVFALKYGSTVAGGSDAFGYINQADSWLAGRLEIDQPFVRQVPWPNASWTFTPLGYRPIGDGTVLTPTYAAGLPLMMAAVKKVAGHAALFWIVPVSAFILVIASFALGRRFGSSSYGLIAAWLVATSPPFLFIVLQPMTDVPVAAVWTCAFVCLLGMTRIRAAGAGVLVSVAILIRPNLAPLAAVPALWLMYRRSTAQVVAYLGSVAPGFIAVALINQHLYGSPFQSGYGDLRGMFSATHLSANLAHYSRWFIDYQTPLALAGVAALLLPLRRIWPRTTDRSVVVMGAVFVAGLLVEYCLYLEFDDWWYLRFLLAAWPFIMIGVATALTPLLNGRILMRAVACVIVIAMGARGIQIAMHLAFFEFGRGEVKYAAAGRLAGSATPPNSVLFAMQHSGSVRYYGGRVTLRYDNLDPRWLDRAIVWLAEHDAHPYALLEDWEIPEFRHRFPAESALARLDDPPRAVFQGVGTVYLFDLLPSSDRGPTQIVLEPTPLPRAVPPGATPTLIFRQPAPLDYP